MDEERGIQDDLMPDFLGILGYNFCKGYAFKIDYKAHVITFYKNAPDGTDIPYLRGEQLDHVIDFTLGNLPNHPVALVLINGIPYEAGFDTGSPDSVYPDEATKKKWLSKGLLKESDGNGVYVLKNVVFENGLQTTIETNVLPPAALQGIKQSIGFRSNNVIELGYGFLSRYKTVWNYDMKKIYLLRR